MNPSSARTSREFRDLLNALERSLEPPDREEGIRILIEYNCMLADLPMVPDEVHAKHRLRLDRLWAEASARVRARPLWSGPWTAPLEPRKLLQNFSKNCGFCWALARTTGELVLNRFRSVSRQFDVLVCAMTDLGVVPGRSSNLCGDATFLALAQRLAFFLNSSQLARFEALQFSSAFRTAARTLL